MRVYDCLQRTTQQVMNVSVLFILNMVDICLITNILYLQQSWFSEQAQQQPFVLNNFSHRCCQYPVTGVPLTTV
jgi:hypothetical protein